MPTHVLYDTPDVSDMATDVFPHLDAPFVRAHADALADPVDAELARCMADELRARGYTPVLIDEVDRLNWHAAHPDADVVNLPQRTWDDVMDAVWDRFDDEKVAADAGVSLHPSCNDAGL